MEDLAPLLIQLIKAHANWALLIMFAIAFAESSAFLSLLFPGVTLMIAAGALMRASALPPLPAMTGSVVGAALGAALSYAIGRRFGGNVVRLWPFTRNLDLLSSGIRFFRRHGGKSVFIGRFYGPIRATIPLAAGLMRMPHGRFWLANIASSLIWAPMLLLVGDAVGEVGERLVGSANTIILVFAGLTLFAAAGLLWAALRAKR